MHAFEPIATAISDTADADSLVLLLHSGAGSARDWRHVTAALPPHLRAVALDFYGAGHMPPWPGPEPLAIDDQAALAISAIERFGRPVHLVGHSYGGAVALRVAILAPTLVSTLVVVEPIVYGLLRELGDPLHDVSLALWVEVRAAFARGDREGGWRRFIDAFSGDRFWDRLPTDVRAAFLASAPLEVWSVVFSNPTTLAELRRLTVPTLVLCGANTAPAERRMCEIVRDAVPLATLEEIAAAGHMSPMTHPRDLATCVQRWLR